MKKVSAILWLFFGLLSALAQQNVVFYGGDFDGAGGIASERNTVVTDARAYDDFILVHITRIEGVWGNFLVSGVVPKMAYYEIREGITEGNGGTLLASGNTNVTVMYTGRTGFGLTEYHIRGEIPPIELASGRYWMTLAPIGFGSGRFFFSELDNGRDQGPPSDPNPPVTGGPIANGNRFFDSPFFGYNFASYDPLHDNSFGVGVLTSITRSLTLADAFTVTIGGGAEVGELNDLWGQDDQRFVVSRAFPFNASSPSVQVVAETFTPVPRNPNGNRLTLTFEARCLAGPPQNVTERIEVFDFNLGQWIVVSERPSDNTDRLTVITRTGRFVEPGTNRLMARISWFDRGAFNLGWSGEIDWVLWDVEP